MGSFFLQISNETSWVLKTIENGSHSHICLETDILHRPMREQQKCQLTNHRSKRIKKDLPSYCEVNRQSQNNLSVDRFKGT